MKRILTFLSIIFMLVAVILPTNVSAQTYTVGGTDLTITIDDSIWYVFTRDNIKDNPELEELGLTYEYMNEFFTEYDAYLDGVLYVDEAGNYIEIFVFKYTDDPEIVNLSNYSSKEVQEVADEVAENLNPDDYGVYETQYKFVKIVTTDELDGYTYYNCQYITIVNKETYSITFSASSPYTDWDYEEMESIVNSIRFNVDESLKEPSNIDWARVIRSGIRVAILAGGGSGLAAMLQKKKSKKDEEEINIIE